MQHRYVLCMYVCMYICMHACMRARVRAHVPRSRPLYKQIELLEICGSNSEGKKNRNNWGRHPD